MKLHSESVTPKLTRPPDRNLFEIGRRIVTAVLLYRAVSIPALATRSRTSRLFPAPNRQQFAHISVGRQLTDAGLNQGRIRPDRKRLPRLILYRRSRSGSTYSLPLSSNDASCAVWFRRVQRTPVGLVTLIGPAAGNAILIGRLLGYSPSRCRSSLSVGIT